MNSSSEYARKLFERGALPPYQIRLRELANTSHLEQVIFRIDSWESLISVIPSSSPCLSSSILPQVSPTNTIFCFFCLFCFLYLTITLCSKVNLCVVLIVHLLHKIHSYLGKSTHHSLRDCSR